MRKDFRTLRLPADLEFTSDGDRTPIEFYLEAMPRAKRITLKLGYFRSSALRVLAYGFARFIAHGGTLTLITNHHFSEDDQKLLDEHQGAGTSKEDRKVSDLAWLTSELTAESQHFFDCLRLLVRLGRLNLIPVKLAPDRMVHFKEGLFEDWNSNYLFTKGSCNFSAAGLLLNGESLDVHRSWGSDSEKCKIETKLASNAAIESRDSDRYIYLDSSDIETTILEVAEEKEVEELMKQELSLLEQCKDLALKELLEQSKAELQEALKLESMTPKLPLWFEPHGYQVEAYENWVARRRRGIFAMATGTGKTLTALYCAFRDFEIFDKYQLVILVPSRILVKQWADDCRKLNFRNLILVSSNHSDWKARLSTLASQLKFDNDRSFVVVATYAALSRGGTLASKLTHLPTSTMLIADEAHNAGAGSVRKQLQGVPCEKRLALSATLKRRFDIDGDLALENFFEDQPPYAYEYSLEAAIQNKVLTKYSYHPVLVELTQEEMETFSKISLEIARLYDPKKKVFRNPDYAKHLLLDRARILHKAANKLAAFLESCKKLLAQRGSFAYTFIYVPEGDSEDEEVAGSSLIDTYMAAFEREFPGVSYAHYTSTSEQKEQVMKNFEDGYTNVLFAMKCLDEGVNVPRTENAIFCSSTGNPRQFVQRRGRILRTHEDKSSAVIYDLVVIPQELADSESQDAAQKVLESELGRVADFASLAKNYYDAVGDLNEVCRRFNIDIHALHEDV